MKHLILTIATFLTTSLTAQLDILNDFDKWTFTNTAGVETYGAMTTTLLGTYGYKNNDTTFLNSPTYEANGEIEVSYRVEGIIEKKQDFMFFQYRVNGVEWIRLARFSGVKDKNKTHLIEAYGDLEFRFILVTNECINTYYDNCFQEYLYYYDIPSWSLYSGGDALPVVFGGANLDCEGLTWYTHSEYNASHFTVTTQGVISNSSEFNGEDNKTIVPASGYSTSLREYWSRLDLRGEHLITLSQTDFDGTTDILWEGYYSNCSEQPKEVKNVYNLQGQEVGIDYAGLKIIHYTDGTIQKIK